MKSPSLIFPLAELVGEGTLFLGMFLDSVLVEDGYGAGLAFATASGRGDGRDPDYGYGKFYGGEYE